MRTSFVAIAGTLVAVATLSVAGCGRYGRPVREPPEQKEQKERTAEKAQGSTRAPTHAGAFAGGSFTGVRNGSAAAEEREGRS